MKYFNAIGAIGNYNCPFDDKREGFVMGEGAGCLILQSPEKVKEYESKVKDFQANEKTMNEAVKEVKVKEVQQLQERMETLQQSAQEKTSKRREEMYKPILEKADKAIKDVAKENKYDYIFDASGGAILFAKDSDNVLSLVKTKLGIK